MLIFDCREINEQRTIGKLNVNYLKFGLNYWTTNFFAYWDCLFAWFIGIHHKNCDAIEYGKLNVICHTDS